MPLVLHRQILATLPLFIIMPPLFSSSFAAALATMQPAEVQQEQQRLREESFSLPSAVAAAINSPAAGKVVPAAPSEPGKIQMYSREYYTTCAIGGILSCGLTHTAVTPLDVVKCNMQTDPTKYKTIGSGFSTILKEQGAAGLMRGWLPTLLGYSAQGAFKFGLYEYFKKWVPERARARAFAVAHGRVGSLRNRGRGARLRKPAPATRGRGRAGPPRAAVGGWGRLVTGRGGLAPPDCGSRMQSGGAAATTKPCEPAGSTATVPGRPQTLVARRRRRAAWLPTSSLLNPRPRAPLPPPRTYADMVGEETMKNYGTLVYLAGSASAEFFADIALSPFEAVKVRVGAR